MQHKMERCHFSLKTNKPTNIIEHNKLDEVKKILYT